MTDTQIVEQNRVIADFMGYIHSEHADMDNWEIANLRYHSDWNQLHGVWHKLYHDYYEVSRRSKDAYNRLHASVFNENYVIHIEKAFLIGDKSAAHRILFEAIQWYNTQNKQQ